MTRLFAPGFIKPVTVTGGGGGGASVAGTQFLARTTGLPTKYTTAYTNLFSSLTTAGFFNVTTGVSTVFDALYIPKTYNETTAYLDLTNEAHNLTKTGSNTAALVFTQNVGWTNPTGGNAALDTGFGVYLRSGGRYLTNNAHISVWNNTDGTDFGTVAMGAEGGGGGRNRIGIKDVWESKFYFYMNSIGQPGFAVGDCRGLWTISRDADTTCTVYQDTTVRYNATVTTDFVPIPNVYLMGMNTGGSVPAGTPTQREHWSFSLGSKMSATQVSDFRAALAQFWVDIA